MIERRTGQRIPGNGPPTQELTAANLDGSTHTYRLSRGVPLRELNSVTAVMGVLARWVPAVDSVKASRYLSVAI
jgi:hypothetical protein